MSSKKNRKLLHYNFSQDGIPENTPVIIENWKTKLFSICVFTLLIVLMFHVNYTVEKSLEYYIGAFATISFIYLLFRIVLSFFYNPVREEPTKNYKVTVVMPSYNESVESVSKAIDCLFKQDYPIHEIIFVDDGSSDLSAYNYVLALSRELGLGYREISATSSAIDSSIKHSGYTDLIVHRLDSNKGKREAMAWGFRHATGDMLMLVDSDGYIYPNATRELLKPFNDDKVFSVVGHINARNVGDNFVTRLQDILYQSAFRVGRAAQSVTNSVLVCSGALSMYRSKVVTSNIDEFLKKSFMGISCENGDDRCLTDIALKYGGKTKYQSTAMCITDVPINTKTFFKQQVRWAKSFYLYTFKSMTHAWNKPFMMMWLVCEGFLWILFSVSQAISLFHWTGNYVLLVIIFSVGYFILSSLVSGIYYVFKNPFIYMLAPLYALMHMFLLFPIRVYALLTINKAGWGTR